MIRVDETKYLSVIRNYAGTLIKSETKGKVRTKAASGMEVTQHKSKEGVTIAQKIVFPKHIVYHIRPAFINF